MAQYKVNLTFPPELMKEIDEYCKAHYLTRSGFVQMASTEFLTAHKMSDAMQAMADLLHRVLESAENPAPEDVAKLNELDSILAMINGRQ